ncbi:hypothetical protein BJ508DRAFT_412739 [Ascobolus immersus RN42]|uniref:Uncharacterized protein n=1 Tax=Ascobolus immersus RN42 TaxID=1160509 RepID=A0A3N4II13_ASCIM|nr:hypothetical protein BJ508DRAFT_412739 [Ascobolus immersus RN42]
MGQLRYLPPEDSDSEDSKTLPLPAGSPPSDFPTLAEAAESYPSHTSDTASTPSTTSVNTINTTNATTTSEPLRQIHTPWPPTRISNERLARVQSTVREQGRNMVRQVFDDSVVPTAGSVGRRNAAARRSGASRISQTGLFGFGFSGYGMAGLERLRDEDELDGAEPDMRWADDIRAYIRPLLEGTLPAPSEQTLARQRRDAARLAARQRALERLQIEEETISVHEFLRETAMFDPSDRSASPDSINPFGRRAELGRRASSISSTAEMLDFMGLAGDGDAEARGLDASGPPGAMRTRRTSVRNWRDTRNALSGITNPTNSLPTETVDDSQYNFQHIVDEIRRIGDSEDLRRDLRNSLHFAGIGPPSRLPEYRIRLQRPSPASSTPVDPSLTTRGQRVLQRQAAAQQEASQPGSAHPSASRSAPPTNALSRAIRDSLPPVIRDVVDILRVTPQFPGRVDSPLSLPPPSNPLSPPSNTSIGTSSSSLEAETSLETLISLQTRLHALTAALRTGSETLRRYGGSTFLNTINAGTSGTPATPSSPTGATVPGTTIAALSSPGTIDPIRLRAHFTTPLPARPTFTDLDPTIPVPTPHPGRNRTLRSRPISPGTQSRLDHIDILIRSDYQRLAREVAELPRTNRDEELTDENSVLLDNLPGLGWSAESSYLEELERVERLARPVVRASGRGGRGGSGLRNSELVRPDATSFFGLLAEFEAGEIRRGGNPYTTSGEEGRSGTRGGAQEVYDSLFTAADLNDAGGFSEDRLLRRIMLEEERERIIRGLPVGNWAIDGRTTVDTGACEGKILGAGGKDLFGGW